MKKITWLVMLFSVMLTYGQTTTIDFDDDSKWTPSSGGSITSYQDGHSYVDGVFSATAEAALRQGNSDQDGFPGALGDYAWRLRNNDVTSWTATIASGGVDDFSVAIRRWDDSPSPDLNLEYSVDGGANWEFVSLINNATLNESSDWTTFSATVESDADNILVRVVPNSSGERIMIDDFEWTAFTSTISAPTTSAPVPTEDAADVVSIFSDAYTDLAIANYDPNWGQSGHTLVNTMFDPTGDGTDFVLAYPNFNYQGTDFGSNEDLSSMDFLHVDIWVAAGTDRMVKVSPINNGTGPGEVLVEVPVTPGSWNSVALPKSDFTDMTWDSVFQLKFDGQFNADGTANTTPYDIYLDNIYFSGSTTSTVGCLVDEYGQWPGTTFTPNPALADGLTVQNITTGGWAGEYSRVNVLEGETYRFSGSVDTDFYTISNGAGDTILAAGFDEVTWVSDADQEIRFWTHTDEDCGFQQIARTRSVVVGTPPDCLPVSDLTTDAVTAEGADFSWSPVANALSYDYVVVLEGEDEDDPVNHVDSGNTTDVNVTISGLAANTTYDLYITSNCNGSSGNPVSITFLTACLTLTAPYSENFDDNGTNLPDCWTQSSTAGQWQVNTTPTFGNDYDDNTTGSGSFAFVDASTFNGAANDITLISPFVDVSSLTNPALEFYVHHFKSQNDADNIITVEVWDGAAWNEVYFDDQADFDGWERVIIDLSVLTVTGDVQVRFIVDNTPDNFYNDIAIDDFSIDEGPACFPVSSLVTANITATGLDFSWDGTISSVDGYEWVIIEETGDITDNTSWIDTGITDVNTTNASSSPVLTPETAYILYVRTDCDTDGFSDWTTTNFVTTVLCPTPSDLTATGIGDASANFAWTGVIAETGGYEYVVLPEGLNPIDDFADNVANGTTAAGETTVSVSGLTSETTYDFYLRSVCDAGEFSEYVSVEFTTACSAAVLNYEEDFTGFGFNINTSTNCWTEGTGLFDTVANGQWGAQNFNNDAANPNGTALYINLWNNSAGVREDWVKSQAIDLGAGSPDNILSYDAYVRPWSATAPLPVTDMGTHSVQVVISEDGGLTWDLATNSVATYDSNNIPSDLADTEEVISLAGYSGEIQIGFYSLQETDTPDLRFYIDNLFIGVPPTCDAPVGLAASNITLDGVELSWDAIDNPADEDVYTWYVFEDGDDPEVDTAVATGVTDATSVVVSGLNPETVYQAYVEADCGADGQSNLSNAISFTTDIAPVIVFPGAPENAVYCYDNNEFKEWLFESSDGSPLQIDFVQGSVEVNTFGGNTFDDLIIYDGQDDTGAVLFDSNNDLTSAADLTGLSLVADSGFMYITLISDGSISCASGDETEIQFNVSVFDPPFTNVQVIHNSPDPAAASVDVYLDGQLLPALTGVGFREASEFLLAPAGVDFTVDIVPAGADLSQSVFTQTFNLDEDENYLIVANGVLDPTGFITDNGFELTVYEGARMMAVDADEVDILVHHGSPDAPAVDVNETTVGNLVSNIAYPEFQGYLSVPEADYTLEIAAAGDPEALVSYLAPLASLGGFEGEAITIVASGFFGDDAGMDNGFGLWVATAAGGPLLELPLIEPDPVFANIQVIHNSPDPVASTVDVYLNGQPSLLMGVDFRTASPFVLAPANEDFVIDVVPVGGDISESVFTATLNLEEDNYVIVANGVLDPSSFENASAFELSIYQGARLVAEEANDVDILVHHGSPDAPAVDVNEPNAGNLVSNIAYPEFQGYLSVPEADYVLEIAPAGDPTPVAIYSAPLATLGGFEGEAITIVASGFFGEDAGMDNGFGLWVATAAGGPLLELPEINTSTLDFDGDNFTYYPNPVETSITIQAKNNVEQVEVFNMLGQRVLVQRPNQTNPSLNMSNMESGIYLMKVSINGANKSFQIIKD